MNLFNRNKKLDVQDWLLYWHFDIDTVNQFRYIKEVIPTVIHINDNENTLYRTKVVPPRVPVALLANPKKWSPTVFSSFDEADHAMTIRLHEWVSNEKEAGITLAAVNFLDNKKGK